MKVDEGNMFASIQAFIRRCKDLLEICYSNSQLYRYEKTNLRCFPGVNFINILRAFFDNILSPKNYDAKMLQRKAPQSTFVQKMRP